MQTRQLGRTDLFITPLGFGSWAVGGGGWQFGWGSQDDRESIAAINRALDLGINWIDTAAVYGLGHSEEIVGRAVKGRTERPYIFTKCSMVWDEKGNTGAPGGAAPTGWVSPDTQTNDVGSNNLHSRMWKPS